MSILKTFADFPLHSENWDFTNVDEYLDKFYGWKQGIFDDDGCPKPQSKTASSFQFQKRNELGELLRQDRWKYESHVTLKLKLEREGEDPKKANFKPNLEHLKLDEWTTLPAVRAPGSVLNMQLHATTPTDDRGQLGFISLCYPPRWTVPLTMPDDWNIDFEMDMDGLAMDADGSVVVFASEEVDLRWEGATSWGSLDTTWKTSCLKLFKGAIQTGFKSVGTWDSDNGIVHSEGKAPTTINANINDGRLSFDPEYIGHFRPETVLDGLCTRLPIQVKSIFPNATEPFLYTCSRWVYDALRSDAVLPEDTPEIFYSEDAVRNVKIKHVAWRRELVEEDHLVRFTDIKLGVTLLDTKSTWWPETSCEVHLKSLVMDIEERLKPQNQVKNPPLALALLPPRTEFTLRRALPVKNGSGDITITTGQKVLYLGYDEKGDMVVEHNELQWMATPSNNFFAPDDALALVSTFDYVDAPQHPNLVRKIHHILHTVKIRKVPIYELLHFLHCQCGLIVRIFIVGGAIRDALLGDDINDIDLAVGRRWHELERDIRTFFTNRGEALSAGDFTQDGTSKKFGMMKIRHITQSEGDGLDIGVLKSGCLLPALQKTNAKYYYGCSLKQDARFRDYTVNAVYLDVFAGQLCDPLNGLEAFQNGKLPFIAVPCAGDNQSRPILKEDVGGRLRLFKLLLKRHKGERMYTVSTTDANLICGLLLADVNMFLRIIATETNGEDVPDKDIAKASLYFEKFAKKIFSPKKPVASVVDGIINEVAYLKDSVLCISVDKWWKLSCLLAHKVLQGETRICSQCLMDSQAEQWTWTILEALSEVYVEHKDEWDLDE